MAIEYKRVLEQTNWQRQKQTQIDNPKIKPYFFLGVQKVFYHVDMHTYM